jgi:hypothetical protein
MSVVPDITSNLGSATVTVGGTDAPAAGTIETFTVSGAINIPAASTGASQFRVVDAAIAGNPALAEIMVVSNVSGATWAVIRGAEAIGVNGTTPVAHAANWTAVVVQTAKSIQNLAAGVAHIVGALATYTLPPISPGVNEYNEIVSHSAPGSPPSTAFTLPTPLGPNDELSLTVQQDTTGGNNYTILQPAGASSQAQWSSGTVPSFTTSANGADIILGHVTDDLTGWVLLSSAVENVGYLPIQEAGTALVTTASPVTLLLPVTNNTVQFITLSTINITIANPATYPASGAVSFLVRITMDATHTVTFPTTNTRWSGPLTGAGTAPTLAASSSCDFVVKCLDGVRWDWSFVGRFA